MARVETIGAKNVLKFYEDFENLPNFKIFRGTNTSKENYVCGSYTEGEKEDGLDCLKKCLKSLSENKNNDNTYTLMVCDKGNKAAQTIIFKMYNTSEDKTIGNTTTATPDPILYQLINDLKEQNNELQSEINALKSEDEKQPTGIAGILTNEHFAPILAQVAGSVLAILQGVAQKFTNQNNQNNQLMNNVNNYSGQRGLAGVPTDETEINKIETAISILMQYDKNLGTHLLKLAEMAQNETTKFNMLLKML